MRNPETICLYCTEQTLGSHALQDSPGTVAASRPAHSLSITSPLWAHFCSFRWEALFFFFFFPSGIIFEKSARLIWARQTSIKPASSPMVYFSRWCDRAPALPDLRKHGNSETQMDPQTIGEDVVPQLPAITAWQHMVLLCHETRSGCGVGRPAGSSSRCDLVAVLRQQLFRPLSATDHWTPLAALPTQLLPSNGLLVVTGASLIHFLSECTA